MLLVAAMVGLLCACATPTTGSSYRVTIPVLTVAPLVFDCRLASGATESCIVLLRRDHENIVRELKTACLALGGTAAQCHTEAATTP